MSTAAQQLPDQMHVTYVPRGRQSFDTPFGEAGIITGAGAGVVVMELSPAAADVLARIIAQSQLAGGPGDVDRNEPQWTGVVLDLMTSAQLCQPDAYPTPVLVAKAGGAS